MEIIIGIVFVILILLLTGLDIGWIIMGIAGLTALAALFTAVFFAVCWVMLLRSEKKSARFVRFESGQRFESAVYLIDGSEYGNVFPAEFVMRGKLYRSDRKFVWADAVIEGNKVIVSSSEVAVPLAVRYGFSNSPRCNLYNEKGLPASPFRTDSWDK